MTALDLCALAAPADLARVRVLARTFREHHPDARCTVVVLDPYPSREEDFAVLSPLEVEPRFAELWAALYHTGALAAALAPRLLERALKGSAGSPVALLAPDARVVGPLDALAVAAGRDALAAVAVPPEAAGGSALDPRVVVAGPEAGESLAWWHRRVEQRGPGPRDPDGDPGGWLEWAAGGPARVVAVSDPGYDAGAWALAQERLEDQPGRLRLLRLPAFDPHEPHILGPEPASVRLSERPGLAALCRAHAAELLAAGHDTAQTRPYAWSVLPDGTVLDARLRRLFRRAAAEGAVSVPPFDSTGAQPFLDWLNEPAERGAHAGVTRFLLELHGDRADLRVTYPDLDGEDGRGFVGWAIVHGAREVPMPPALVPPDRHGARSPDAGPRRPAWPWGVNVAGYFQSELGVGEAARLVIAGLDAARVPLMPVHGERVPPSRRGHAFASVGAAVAPFGVNLICVNADGLGRFAEDVGPAFFAGRYSIGLWWWELDRFPEHLMSAFQHLDEVWVGSDHVADGLDRVAPVRVCRITLPVRVPPVAPITRAELGLPDGFLFLFLFDHHSVFERKNPLGALAAFRRAFPADEPVALVLKSINAASDPANHEKLLLAAAEDPRIHVRDGYVPAGEKNAMIAASDCFVSLHRSEGFGLTLAEAMLLGRPVVATGYGGNLDFMTEQNSYLVPYERRPVGPGADPYPADGEWAEPDVERAAELLRLVFERPEEAGARGRLGAADIRRTHGPEAASRSFEARLERVRRELEGRPDQAREHSASPAMAGLAELRELVRAEPPPPSGETLRGPKRLTWEAVQRALRPWAQHRRKVDEKTLDLLEASLERLERSLANAVARDDMRAAELDATVLTELRRLVSRVEELEARRRFRG